MDAEADSKPANVLDLADRLWDGRDRIEEHHPVGLVGDLVEVAPRTAFVPSFANATAFQTGDGLVLIDTGGYLTAAHVHGQVRGWTDQPLHTAVYSHGHVDHVFGVPLFEGEDGAPAVHVVAHENVPRRFERYALTAGYNSAINERQFQVKGLTFPSEFRQPDETYRDELAFEVGGERFELRHGKGETDDATWTWIPGRGVICCGDFVIWAAPNAGNPQKAQRYPREWAQALRAMAALDAELLLPGHGPPVVGAERVQAVLGDTAALLESLVEQTLALMNRGARLDEVLAGVEPPADLLEKPYLRPVYDQPEFVVRNLWRQYGGWYEGDPARLEPARESELAAEVAGLAGGPETVARRALELLEAGDLALAGHLSELAFRAGPDNEPARAARERVNERRAAEAASTMARGVYTAAAAEARASEDA